MSAVAHLAPAKDMLSRRHLVVGVAAGTAVALLGRRVLAAVNGTTPTAQEFAGFLNQGFLVTGNNVTTTLTLIQVKALDRGTRVAKFPDPFLLLFRARPDDKLADGIYAVQDPAGQSTQMFVSQVSADRSVYQAVFS